MAGIEIRGGELALELGLPQVRPALEFHALYQIGPVADRVNVSPRADVKRTDLRLVDETLGVRDLRQVERLEQPVIGVEPADMRGREGDVAFGAALGELRLVQPIDGAAGDELDIGSGLLLELLGRGLGDEVAPAASPDADNELLLRAGRKRKQGDREESDEGQMSLHDGILLLEGDGARRRPRRGAHAARTSS